MAIVYFQTVISVTNQRGAQSLGIKKWCHEWSPYLGSFAVIASEVVA